MKGAPLVDSAHRRPQALLGDRILYLAADGGRLVRLAGAQLAARHEPGALLAHVARATEERADGERVKRQPLLDALLARPLGVVRLALHEDDGLAAAVLRSGREAVPAQPAEACPVLSCEPLVVVGEVCRVEIERGDGAADRRVLPRLRPQQEVGGGFVGRG